MTECGCGARVPEPGDPAAEATCPGYCCAVLPLPWTIDQLRADEDDPDALKIADMLIPLTYPEAIARARKFGSPAENPPDIAGPTTHWYACRHWDEETLLCTIYEERPDMCRGYPYDRDCRHGCSYRQPPSERARWANFRREAEQEVAEKLGTT